MSVIGSGLLVVFSSYLIFGEGKTEHILNGRIVSRRCDITLLC